MFLNLIQYEHLYSHHKTPIQHLINDQDEFNREVKNSNLHHLHFSR